MSDFGDYSGEIEFIGRAMTREQRERRKFKSDNTGNAGDWGWLPVENKNYIPIEDLVDPELRPLLKELLATENDEE